MVVDHAVATHRLKHGVKVDASEQAGKCKGNTRPQDLCSLNSVAVVEAPGPAGAIHEPELYTKRTDPPHCRAGVFACGFAGRLAR